jgi:hypothetical protein
MKFSNAYAYLRKLLPQPGETLPQKLDRLAEIQRQEAVLAKPYREQIATIEAKMAEEVGPLTEMMQNLEKEIKEDCIQLGKTTKGAFWQVIYSSGRETCDIKGLKGYAAAHKNEKVLQFINKGKPYATLKEVKA